MQRPLLLNHLSEAGEGLGSQCYEHFVVSVDVLVCRIETYTVEFSSWNIEERGAFGI
jgi:hypothetical protein